MKIKQCITCATSSLAAIEAGEWAWARRRGDSHMMRDIGLMYIEGEVKAGQMTGRTVLVIETSREIDPGQPGYSATELRRLVSAASAEWERSFGPADIIRLDYQPAFDRASTSEKRSFRA